MGVHQGAAPGGDGGGQVQSEGADETAGDDAPPVLMPAPAPPSCRSCLLLLLLLLQTPTTATHQHLPEQYM